MKLLVCLHSLEIMGPLTAASGKIANFAVSYQCLRFAYKSLESYTKVIKNGTMFLVQ